jgi:hypothetical protein
LKLFVRSIDAFYPTRLALDEQFTIGVVVVMIAVCQLNINASLCKSIHVRLALFDRRRFVEINLPPHTSIDAHASPLYTLTVEEDVTSKPILFQFHFIRILNSRSTHVGRRHLGIRVE